MSDSAGDRRDGTSVRATSYGVVLTQDQHSHFKRWGAAYLLLGFFLASWGQFISMLVEIGNDARQHGQSFSMDEFWPQFFSATFENWRAMLQLLAGRCPAGDEACSFQS